MQDLDKIIILENYTDNLEYYYDQIKMLYKFLNIENPNVKEGMKKTLAITKDKIAKLKKCRTLEDYDRYVNIDKIIKDHKKGLIR